MYGEDRETRCAGIRLKRSVRKAMERKTQQGIRGRIPRMLFTLKDGNHGARARGKIFYEIH